MDDGKAKIDPRSMNINEEPVLGNKTFGKNIKKN